MSMGSTRVFGQESSRVDVVGLKRRPGSDLYHWLVTGSWTRLLLVCALVYFATALVFAAARWLLAARLPADVRLDPLALLDSGATRLPDAREVAAGVLAAVEGFVRWAEVLAAGAVVLAKFSHVRARVLFSEVAVVSPHAGGEALMFRMANERASHIVDARVSVMLVRNELHEGEVVRRAHDLALVRGETPLFSHAWTAIHPLGRGSPLEGETAGSLEGSEAEIIVNLTGFDEALVRTVHARHVYPASRLRWNARFREIVKLREDGRRVIDYRKFHKTVAAERPEAPAERTSGRRAR
jgi:inward rectifier potassium channel